jgi:hypothetical protein
MSKQTKTQTKTLTKTQSTQAERPGQRDVSIDLSKVEIQKDFGLDADLNKLLNHAMVITQQKAKNRGRTPIEKQEVELYTKLAKACLTTVDARNVRQISVETLKALYKSAFEKGEHTKLFKGVPEDRTPVTFSREINAEYTRLKNEMERKLKADIARKEAQELEKKLQETRKNIPVDSFELDSKA